MAQGEAIAVGERGADQALPAAGPAAAWPSAASPGGEAGHRIPLEGTTWSMWRDVCLRSAGFPADMLLAVCDEPLARSADLAGADLAGPYSAARLAYDSEYGQATRRLSTGIAGTYAYPGFHEAITWQNAGVAQYLDDHNAGVDVGAARRNKVRERELLIANYLQRYCLKNDTIGFFGPVGWASADPGVPGLVVAPGEQLIARRATYFEFWAIDKVAAAVAGHGRTLGWLRPRRPRSTFLAGNVLHRPHRKPVTLTDAELAILQACDGSATISEITDSAGADARALLARLAELGALRLDLEGPADTWPERLLRDQLELIADPAARAAALEPVDRIIRARDEVAAASGDAVRVRQAMAGLAATFEEVTGSPATRRAGQTYAGRTLIYQDSVRDVQVELGQAVTKALAAPLGLVLDSARWLVNEIMNRYRELFAELVDSEMARNGGAPVPLSRLLTVAAPYLYTGSRGGLAEENMAELQRRWREVLGPPQSASRHQVSADAIAGKVAECFPGRPLAWSGARQYSPDIMIAAASPAEVERGNFLLVLGEVHLATNTLDQRCLVEQHPDRARLVAAERADRGPGRIVPIQAKDNPNVTSRSSPPSALMAPGQLYWSAATSDSYDPDESSVVLPGAAMSVTRRGEDLVVQVAPSATELDFFEVIGDLMSGVVVDALQPVARAAHRPRITIDKLVLSREQWVCRIEDCGWAFAKNEQERYYLARRWRQEIGLPERVFYRVPGEIKPTAADFRSIVLVNLLAKHIRQTHVAEHTEFTVTEMLPDIDQLWLTDRQGRHYSSELRIVAYDAMTEDGGER